MSDQPRRGMSTSDLGRLPVPGEDPHYLGDAVYVTHEPGLDCLWLWTRRDDGVHKIALEPSAVSALVRYAHSKGIDPEDKP